MEHRHKQRVLTTLVTFIVLTIAVDAFLILRTAFGVDLALLFAFTAAVGLTTAYQTYNHRHSREHVTFVNTLTQIYLGSILFIGCVLALLLQLLSVTAIDSYIAMAALVLLLISLSLKRFDAHLEDEIKRAKVKR